MCVHNHGVSMQIGFHPPCSNGWTHFSKLPPFRQCRHFSINYKANIGVVGLELYFRISRSTTVTLTHYNTQLKQHFMNCELMSFLLVIYASLARSDHLSTEKRRFISKFTNSALYGGDASSFYLLSVDFMGSNCISNQQQHNIMDACNWFYARSANDTLAPIAKNFDKTVMIYSLCILSNSNVTIFLKFVTADG